MQFASVLVVFLLIIDKIRYLRLLGLFLNSSSCLQHFLIKLSCLLLLPLGRRKIHFPRIFTLKPVTSCTVTSCTAEPCKDSQLRAGVAVVEGLTTLILILRPKKKYITRKFKLARGPALVWRENTIAVVILLRVLAGTETS